MCHRHIAVAQPIKSTIYYRWIWGRKLNYPCILYSINIFSSQHSRILKITKHAANRRRQKLKKQLQPEILQLRKSMSCDIVSPVCSKLHICTPLPHSHVATHIQTSISILSEPITLDKLRTKIYYNNSVHSQGDIAKLKCHRW